MEDPLGEGAFGEVYKGVVKGPLTCSRLKPTLRNAICVPVAIKLLKGECMHKSKTLNEDMIETVIFVS